MEELERKIINTKVKYEDFDLLDVIQQHFIITKNYIYDLMCVRPIRDIKEIEFYEDKNKSDQHITVGLLRVCWENCYDEYETWYILNSHTSKYGVVRTELKYVE